ncbi:MAG: NAD-dependent dihydropyrimidine dehydrogenase subunit PreA [Erysipelotrichaceae bacterium]|nr:NAD-dependent dihydropyrimidine dehydrogenase subunit PreA [Erysipelotrichaceae bacterium]
MLFKRVINRKDMINCMLCLNGPCASACGKLKTDDLLESIWFENEKVAALKLPETNPCTDCDAPCEKACLNAPKVEIKKLVNRLYDEIRPELEVGLSTDEDKLRTDICGIPLDNPFLLSSSVVASSYDMCARAFEAGFAGASFKTICPFEIHEASPRFSAITGEGGTIVGFKNVEQLSQNSVEENMEIFRKLKQNYPNKVIIASIMGGEEEDWGRLAKICEESGADVIELNFSCPNMQEDGLGSDIGENPELIEKFTRIAKQACSIPVLPKLTPNVQFMSPAAEAAIRGGADGIAAINTVKSVVGVNPHTYVSAPAVKGKSAIGGYSGNAIKPIALRFISELGNNKAMQGKHISGMGGIETWLDAVEFLLLGAGSLQITTAIMQYGYRIIDDLKSGLLYYLDEKGFSSVNDIRGLGLDSISETTDVLERDTVIYPKFLKDKCKGCGRCVISCNDGGHQAITLDENRKPILNGRSCVGCHLCILVCPEQAIIPGLKRVPKIIK